MQTNKPVPQNSRFGIDASSNSEYLRKYRERRVENPHSRIAKKLKLMTTDEVKEIERAINTLLGKDRLPDPSNPWFYDRRVHKPKIRKSPARKPKSVVHKDMIQG